MNIRPITVKCLLLLILGIGVGFFVSKLRAQQELISLFPIENYNQTTDYWIKPQDADYNTSLLTSSAQQDHMKIFFNKYFGDYSPWNADYITRILSVSPPDDLKSLEQDKINGYSNQNKPQNEIGYGENFRPHTKAWLDNIVNNINLSQFTTLSYQPNQRGIAIDNLNARVLPTDDVHFYSYKLAGQGYPFDNLQMSALWIGTPVYILGESRDHAFMLVMTPDYVAWVKASGIARVDDSFIQTWTNAAKNKLMAITRTQTPLLDENNKFLAMSYVGSVFPAADLDTIMVPVADAEYKAVIKKSRVSAENSTAMPLTTTPHNFANIMSTLLGRPYGWGGIYFYNDCSAELKSFFTPFGIWLPRHSSDQVEVGKMVDKSSSSPADRIAWLAKNGRKFLSVVYIGGHVFLYVGNHADGILSYQNVWGLSPKPPIRRAVIGQSVLLPVMLQYPEDTSLVSAAGKKYFRVSFLDQLQSEEYLLKSKMFSLRALMTSDSD